MMYFIVKSLIYRLGVPLSIFIIKDGVIQLVKKTVKDNLQRTNLNIYNKYKYIKDALHKKKKEKNIALTSD
jgi:sulfur relay (sulfurtransferase) DsrF/TusC family protein